MKKLISHILIALTGMLAVSCNAWLDVTPENAIADDDLFSTGFGYRNALNGIYTNLASDELYGKQLSWGFLSAISQQYNQKAGTISPMYADASELIYNTVDTEPVVTAIWEKGYKVIANLNKLIENIRPTDMVRIPSFIVVIASFVTLLQMVMQAYVPGLYATLGLFIPLIVVNCIVLGRAEAFAAKNNAVASMFDGIGMGLGFTIALTLLGAVREFLGTGKIFDLTIMPEEYGMLVFVLAPGAFIALGYLIALINSFKKA